MIGIIFLVVLLSTLWTAVIVLSLPLVIAVVPTIAVVLTGAGIFLYRRLEARKAAREIERTLKAQGEEYVKQVRPDQQPEIEAMQAEFAKAIASLKSSKLARGGSDALSVLPWYMIIGPPGVGKSTALRNSGLQFPYLSARGGSVKGVGGTRNCEWWLTNEAVILDTAGRYTTQDDDREEWFSFLDMLGKNRAKKPVNGLLVAVSVGDFVELDEEGAAALGQRIRERVDEVMSRLKMILPVYVMFTKCDLLAGFVEMFGDLPKAERGQIWGTTESVTAKTGPAGEVFATRFDELAMILQERALQRIGQSRRLEDRERVFQFPAQFEGLRSNLTEFIRTLFAENVYQDTPVMRGFYFSSATQEGRPIDRMMNAMASAFGIAGALPAASESSTETKSYFLQDFFSRVLFKDQGLAVRSTKEAKRQGVLQYGYAAGGFAVAALLMLFPTISFFKNRELLQSARETVASVRKGGGESGSAALLRLDPLRDQLDDLLESRGGLWMGFGMYQGDNVLEGVSRFYATSVRRALIEPVLEQDLRELSSFVDRHRNTEGELTAKEAVPYFQKLRLHLLLSMPRETTEPQLTERELVAKQLAASWSGASGVSPKAVRSAEAHAAIYLKLLARDPSLGVPRNELVVKNSRKVLRRLPIVLPVLERVIEENSGEELDLTVAGLLDSPFPPLKGRQKIRGAFTKKVYQDKICGNFPNLVKNLDAWVVASEEGALDSETAAQQLRSRYLAQYKSEWRTFLDSLTLEGPSEDTQAVVLLELLTKGEPPPLAQLFRNAAANVRLAAREDKPSGLIEKGKRYISGSSSACHEDGEKDVEDTFEGFVSFGAPMPSAGGSTPPTKKQVPLDSYQQQLEGIRDAMRAKQDVAARVATGIAQVKLLIQNQPVKWQERFHALLMPPLEGTGNVDVKKKSGEISQKWCSEVYVPFKKNLAQRYPFTRAGPDATVADVADFFRPNVGTLWSFYARELKSDVPRVGEQFQFKAELGNEARKVYKPELKTFLGRALAVSNVLFSSSSPEAQVSFTASVQPNPKVAVVTFTVDGTSLDYRNAPDERVSMKWPSPGKTPGASLVARSSKGVTDRIDYPGEWGFFRLLEAGTVRAAGSGVFTVSWKLPNLDTELAIDFRPARSETPFGVLKAGHTPQLLEMFRTASITPPSTAGYYTGGCTK